MNIDLALDVGNLLAAGALLFGLWKYLAQSAQDHMLRVANRATTRRSAVSETLSMLDRLKSLHFTLFESVKPVYVTVKTELYDEFDKTKARDKLWGELHKQRLNLFMRMYEENLERTYQSSEAFELNIREPVQTALAEVSEAFEDAFTRLLDETQDVIAGLPDETEHYDPADLWNSLMEVTWDIEESTRDRVASVIEPLAAQLTIHMSHADAYLAKSRA